MFAGVEMEVEVVERCCVSVELALLTGVRYVKSRCVQ